MNDRGVDMLEPDDAVKVLKAAIAEFAAFCSNRGGASETDTRIKLIDRVLKDVLGWPEPSISREDHVDSGYIDYCLNVNMMPSLAVEAKRQDAAFTLAKKHTDEWYNLDGVLVQVKSIKEAIDQVRGYCDDHDPPIRYAVATNGYTWIVFRAVRDDIGWRKGRARVFPSLEEVAENFAPFWNLLSYREVAGGSLTEAFSSSLKVSRRLYRVSELLFNADLPLLRNGLTNSLRPLITLIFEDIADQAQLEVLQSCYVHTGSLRVVANDLDDILTESIPKFLSREGTRTVGQDDSDGGFDRSVAKSIGGGKGKLYLLLGGIGSGKTTFLKRYQRTTGKDLLASRTMWFSIDFLKAPQTPDELERFAWSSIITDSRAKYAERKFEKLSHLREIFADKISVLESTVLSGFRLRSSEYDKVLGPYLAKWQDDLSDYLPRLLKQSSLKDGLKLVLFVDNVDQLGPSYQAKIFLLSQRICRLLESITLVSLREESYYSASVQKTFTAFTTHKFHVASPHFRELIGNRITYTINLVSMPMYAEAIEDDDTHMQKSIADFLHIVQASIFDRNKRITRFVEAICHGNMRFALKLFTNFLTSGATDVEKMLRIYRRDGKYNVAYHEFVKSIMLADRQFYNEDYSPIMNAFNVGAHKNSSHFTSFRLMNVLLAHRSESSAEGRGYVSLHLLINDFEQRFDNRDDTVATLTRLLNRRLIESNTRSSESLEGVSHLRVTSAGWYYCRYLTCTFAYLDLVLQDTPFNDVDTEKYLRDSVYQVNNMSDREEEKVHRVNARFLRVERFLDYLIAQENNERKEFGLDGYDHPMADSVMPYIKGEYIDEKGWIRRRLSENRERFEDDAPFKYNTDEARGFGLQDD